jgi:AcrR family transcriptional regulator
VKRPTQARARATRDRILDAAEWLFDSAGYAELTMNALADKAGVSVGGLYQWFANKEEVLTAVAERHLDHAAGAIAANLQSTRPETLEDFARAVFEPALAVHAERPDLHRFLYGEAPRPPALQTRLRAVQAGMENALAPLLEREGLDPRTARVRAALAVRAGEAALHEFVLDATLPGSVDDRLAELVSALLALLRRP